MLATLTQPPLTITTDPGVYVRNLVGLWQYDPRLAMALERIHPDDLPPVEPARDGNWTIRVTPAIENRKSKIENLVYLHSRYRPIQEAESWAAGIKYQDKYVVVVSGFGLGYHIKALFARLPEEAVLVVAEPNLPLLKAALQAVELAAMLATGRLMIFTALDRGALVDRLEPRAVLFTAGEGTLFAGHPASAQVAPEFHAAFQKMITEFVSFTRTSFVTLMLNNVATCRNVANNLGRYASTPPLDLLQNAYRGIPAVLVAAGPSLQKNMHLLHEIKANRLPGPLVGPRRAVIIAVQTMLKPLLAAGIEPDFVTSLDYNTVSTRFFENLEESGSTGRVHLVAEAKANWNVLDVFPGSMSLLHNDFAARLLREAMPPRQGLKAGATVAHLSFYLAEFLGCDPIILTGQDLGFVDGLYYKPGTAIHETWGVELGRFNTLETKEWERIVRSRTVLRKIPDIYGHPMYTEEQFFTYLQQFERDFAASRSRVIDATEGGAKKQHVTMMTLREAIDRFCEPPPSPPASPQQQAPNAPIGASLFFSPIVPAPPPQWKTWACDLPANLQRVIAALETRRQSAQDMKKTCAETLPLLERMLETQDSGLSTQDFVAIDRLRTRVGNDPQTFEMVCYLNTIGELRKFQAELLVKSAKDPMERQKRQLLRDMDYVKNLGIGADRLLEMLDESLTRLHRQLAAAMEGKPWPREVAGAAM